MSCVKKDSDLTPEEKECFHEICSNGIVIREAIQFAIDSLGLTKSYRVSAVSLMREAQIHAPSIKADFVEICACCSDPAYKCCYVPGCDPCG